MKITLDYTVKSIYVLTIQNPLIANGKWLTGLPSLPSKPSILCGDVNLPKDYLRKPTSAGFDFTIDGRCDFTYS